MTNGWQTTTLGEAFITVTGSTPPTGRTELYGDFMPFVKPPELRDYRFAAAADGLSEPGVAVGRSLPAQSILVSCIGNLGKVGLNEVPVAFNQQINAILPNKRRALPEFMFFQALSEAFKNQLEALSSGTTIRIVNKSRFNSIKIVLPPLAEQQRIVGILDQAFENIAIAKANAEKNLQNARDLFESFLNVAIQGKLIPQNSRDTSVVELISQIEKARNVAISEDRAKPEKTEAYKKDRDQVKLPNSWKWARLESLTVGISDGVHKKPQYASKGIPFITVKNLTAGSGISFDELNYITREDHKEFIKRTHPEKGDILITKDGTIGVVRLIETDIEFSIFVSVALIKPVMHELGPYLVYALRAPCVQSQIVPQGAALKHLYLVDLRRLAIPLPPLSEQKRIVASLNSLNAETEHLAGLYQRKLAALEALKKSLLHQAFTGKL